VQDLSKYRSVIFDCDGVILQSNEIKTDAFREVLSEEPKELVDQFVLYHKKNGGISRYVKFRYYYNNIKRSGVSKEKFKEIAESYGRIVLDKLMTVDYVPGVIDAITYFNSKKIQCFVISGGDQKELHEIFKYRKKTDKFKGIFGGPVTKREHIMRISQDDILSYPAIFFGDAYSDMDAALSNKIDFCFVGKFSDWTDGNKVVQELGYKVIDDFEDLVMK